MIPGSFISVTPARVLDTRSNLGAIGPIPAQGTRTIQISGKGGIPSSGVAAVVVNLTVTAPTSSGYITAWPTGIPKPNASNLNYTANQTIPNLVVVPLGTNGQISVFNGSNGSTQLLGDVAGYYLAGTPDTPGAFTSVTPARVLDTRSNLGAIGPIPAQGTRTIQISGKGGIPSSGVAAVVVNLTVTAPTSSGYITAWPTGIPKPNASNLNYTANQTIPNLVVVPLGTNGQISVFNGSNGSTQLLGDVAGYYLAGTPDTPGAFTSVTPARVLDTRSNLGAIGPIPAQGTRTIQISGKGGIPSSGVAAVVVNFTVTAPTSSGYITAWPTGIPKPNASNLNYTANQTIPNLVVVPLGTNGQISVFNGSNGSTQLLGDVAGYYLAGDIQAPGSVSSLVISRPTTSGLTLSWVNPVDADFTGVIIRRNVGSTAPTTVSTGTPVADLPSPASSFTDTGLSPGTIYSYAVFAHDGVPNYAPAATKSGTTAASADITPPGPVTNLIVAGTTSAAISLSWTNPTDSDYAGVMVRRSVGNAAPVHQTDGTLVAKVTAPTTTLTDTGRTSGTTYSYSFFTYDEVPNYQDPVTVTGTTALPPGPVTGFAVASSTPTSVSLSWTNPGDDDFAGVMVRRLAGSTAPTRTSGTLVDDVAAPGTSVTDTGLTQGTTYTYAAFSHDDVPTYAVGATVTTTTPSPDVTAPPVPSGLAVESRDGAVGLSWNASTAPDISAYEVFYATSQTRQYTSVGLTSAPDHSVSIGNLTNGTKYWFTLDAIDTSGNTSLRATPVSGTPKSTNTDANCAPIATNTVWGPGLTHTLTCVVVVNAGVTLTISPGAVVKGFSSTYLQVLGTLNAVGTTANPITFTDIRDDSVGGDDNGDGTGSSPAPGGWGGISVASPDVVQPPSVTLNHVKVSYAGVSVSTAGDDRDTTNYVARTTSIINSTFNHGSSLSVSAVGPITVTGNTISNVGTAEVTPVGVAVQQSSFLAATTVTGNSVSGVQWETPDDSGYCGSGPTNQCGVGVTVDVQPANTVSPVVSGNSIANTNHEAWAVSSSSIDPTKLTGNTGASSSLQGFILDGTLTHNLTLPFTALPLVLGGASLTVAEGVTLQVAPGTVIKSRGGGLYVVGTLNAPGTSTSPITFTSTRDDSVGGDYNQDGGITTATAGSWGGISGGSDAAASPSSVNLSYTTVSYAGISVSTTTQAAPVSLSVDHLALSYGALTDANGGDDRDSDNYVGRTTSITNSTFKHGSSILVSAAGPVTVTGNTVTNAGTEQTPQGISVSQTAYLTSTVVSGNSVTGVSAGIPDNSGNCGGPSLTPCGIGLAVDVQSANTVSPVVTGNAIANTNHEAWLVSSSALDPTKLTGNTGAGTSLQGFILDGTLTGNLTLPFQTLPLVLGTGNLTVGEGTTLQIAPGTIIKSRGGALDVLGTLNAPGTSAAPISFTSYRDDTVGGDYNKDGTVTTPGRGDWGGIQAGPGLTTPATLSLTYTNVAYGSISGYSNNPLSPISLSADHLTLSYGALNDYNVGDDRDNNNYVARATSITNSTFKHNSSLAVDSAGPITVTGNTVTNTSTELMLQGISVSQSAYLASTTVTGNSVTGVAYSTPDDNSHYDCGCIAWDTPYGVGLGVRILPANNVSPVITSNSLASTNHEAWWVSSSALDPTKLTGNTGASTALQGFILDGTLTGNLTLPFQTLPLVLGTGSLTVGEGTTLQIAPGTVTKSRGGALDVIGTLNAPGSSGSMISFTSWRDDTIGGDYNKDGTVTTPGPRDWSGIQAGSSSATTPAILNLTYAKVAYGDVNGQSTNDQSPVSLTADHLSLSYGRLSDSTVGDDLNDPNYVSRATSITNSTFTHGSSVSINSAGPIVVTGNNLSNASSEYSGQGISVTQAGFDVNTTVTGNVVSGVSDGTPDGTYYPSIFDGQCYYYAYFYSYTPCGIGLAVSIRTENTISPTVQNNTISNTNHEAWFVSSSAIDPAKLTGNTGASTSLQGFILEGTLTHNLSLPFQTLPLVLGTGSLTVAQGAALSIAAGAILKSRGGGLTVNGSLTAPGTSASPVTLTSWRDDSIGGDYNKDGTVTKAARGDWGGIATDAGGSTSISGGVLRFASTALSLGTGTVTYRGKINNNSAGASAANCDPNSGSGSPIDARGVDWGTSSGPFPYGTGDSVNQCVIVQPWVGETNFRARYWGGSNPFGGQAGSAFGSYGYLHGYGGDPVDVATGNLSLALTDVTVDEPGTDLVFARAYNSQSDLTGALGAKWVDSWETHLTLPAGSPTTTYDLHWGDGRIDSYVSGTLAAAPGNFTTLQAIGSTFVATTKQLVKYTFSATGALQSVVDANGNTLTVTTDAQGRVTSVTDVAGRTLTLAYTGTNLTTVTDAAGKVTTYSYSAAGDLASVTDPTGAKVSYTYDINHQLLTAVDALQNPTLTNVYDANGRVIQQTDANGGLTTFTYSSDGTSSSEVDPRGNSLSYTFDPSGQILTSTDQAGGTTTNVYTNAGLLFNSTDPLGRVTRYTYDARGNRLTVLDPLRKTTAFTYNALNLVTQVTDRAGGVASSTYDSNGNLTSTTNEVGKTTSYTVNARGLRTSATDALSKTTNYTYDAAGNLASSTDPLGHVTSATYDALGRPLSSTDALGKVTRYGYNARGDRTTVTDPYGKTTTTTFDAAGHATSVTDPLGHTVQTTYGPTDLPLTVVDQNGKTTTNTYDANGNLSTTTDPTGSQTSYTYDPANRRTSVTDALQQTSTTTYDLDGEVTSVSDPMGGVVNKTYDLDGNLTSVTDANSHITNFSYDAVGRLTTLKDANAHTWTTVYDAAGHITSQTDPLQRTSSSTYDGDGRPATVTDAAGGLTSYSYDAAGRRTAASYPGGTSASYAYDLDGRLTSTTDPSGTASQTYDDDGRTSTATDGLGQQVSYTYDVAGRLTSRTQPGATTNFAYDPAGRMTAATDPAGNASWTYDDAGALATASLPNGVSATITTDLDHQVTEMNYQRAGSTIFDESLTYDTAGRITGVTDPTGTHTYGYDLAGQLTSDALAGGNTTGWTYDGVGNRVSQTGTAPATYSYDKADELVSSGSTTYSYDAKGNLTSVAAPGSTTTYAWNGQNQLVGTTTPSGTTTNVVDDSGVLLKQTGFGATTYLTDRVTGQLLSQGSSRTLVGATPYATATGGSVRALVLDHLGTARDSITSTGTATSYNYSPFGKTLGSAAGAAVPGFAGGLNQSDGTVKFGARSLDPTTGRWTSQDPTGLREANSALSSYTYVQNNPLTLTDLAGLSSSSRSTSSGARCGGAGDVFDLAGNAIGTESDFLDKVKVPLGAVKKIASGLTFGLGVASEYCGGDSLTKSVVVNAASTIVGNLVGKGVQVLATGACLYFTGGIGSFGCVAAGAAVGALAGFGAGELTSYIAPKVYDWATKAAPKAWNSAKNFVSKFL